MNKKLNSMKRIMSLHVWLKQVNVQRQKDKILNISLNLSNIINKWSHVIFIIQKTIDIQRNSLGKNQKKIEQFFKNFKLIKISYYYHKLKNIKEGYFIIIQTV